MCIAYSLAYSTNITSLLSYLKDLQGKARGVCVLDTETVIDDFLDKCHVAGVQSIRLDLFKHDAMHDLNKQIAIIYSTTSHLQQWGKA
jgi:hypothetical protein